MTIEERAPVETIQRLYRLFGEGRLEETFDLMHPDVRLHEPGDPERLPWAGTFEGHVGLRRFYDALGSSLSAIEIDPSTLELLAVGPDQVLAIGTERGVSSASGRSYSSRSAWLWTVEAGQIRSLQAFHDTAAMTEAFIG